MRKPTQDDVLEMLNSIYSASLTGIQGVFKPIEQVADDYLTKYDDPEIAIKTMMKNQITKCATSGFITGFGGLITMPVTIPANLSSVIYMQIRMVQCCAYVGGFNINDDEVRTFIYSCIAGVSIAGTLKKFGVNLGNKLAIKAVERIPGKVLIAINKKIGFRLLTRFGEKGLINFGKMVPVVGAAVNSGLDYAETKIIARRAFKKFIKKDFTPDKTEVIIDVDDIDIT